MGLERLGFELRVELAAEEERVTGDLDYLHVGRVRRSAGDAQACAGEQGLVFAVEFVTMAVPFADLCGLVGAGSDRILRQYTGPRAQAHGAAHLLHAGEFAQLEDDAVGSGGVEFAGAGADQAANIAGILDAGCLHAQADTEVGHVVFARIADGVEHAFDAPLAESTGNQDAVKAGQLLFVAAVARVFAFQSFGLDPVTRSFRS
jgi:hypothetical protein